MGHHERKETFTLRPDLAEYLIKTPISNGKEKRVSNDLLPWDEEALKRLEKIPGFVRYLAKRKIEEAAKDAGESKVSVEFMDVNKAKMMG